MGMSKYENRELTKIHHWKSPTRGFFGTVMNVVNAPLNLAGALVMEIPGVEWVIEKSVGGILNLMNDMASATVWTDAILSEFDPPLDRLGDVYTRDLADVDEAIGYLAAKYKTLASVEGAAAGTGGAAGIAVDIPFLLALNLRAIGEYATYCGFDVSRQEERLFALNVLGLASSPSDAAKQVAMAQLVKIAADVARKRAWKELEQHVFVRIIQQIAKALAIRLTKAKLAQVLPVVGAAVGGGFNAYFTAKVCDAAYFLYRERFLAAKYGAGVVEITVKPAADGDYGAYND